MFIICMSYSLSQSSPFLLAKKRNKDATIVNVECMMIVMMHVYMQVFLYILYRHLQMKHHFLLHWIANSPGFSRQHHQQLFSEDQAHTQMHMQYRERACLSACNLRIYFIKSFIGDRGLQWCMQNA